MVRTTAGDYGKFTNLILKDFIKLIDLNHLVNPCSIRELLQRALPNRKYISADDVCNARVRAKMLMKQIKENGHSIETFQYNEDVALGLLTGLDDVTEYIIDKAMQCSKEIFQDYLYDQNHKIKFMVILEKLASIDSDFIYNFCVDESNKITGFV